MEKLRRRGIELFKIPIKGGLAKMKEGLKLIATKEFTEIDEIYKIVNFLNKNLAEFNVVFGVQKKENVTIMNIYRGN